MQVSERKSLFPMRKLKVLTTLWHVTLGKTAWQVRPAKSMGVPDQVGPQEPKQDFLGFDKEESRNVRMKLAKRKEKLDSVVVKLKANEISVTEAQLMEPPGPLYCVWCGDDTHPHICNTHTVVIHTLTLVIHTHTCNAHNTHTHTCNTHRLVIHAHTCNTHPYSHL